MSATIHITMYRSREFDGTRGRRAALFFTARAAPPGAKTTFKDVDGPFHETAFVGDTHTHTHMHGTHARSRHIDRALPRFHAKETISNAEVATYTLHSSRLDSRYTRLRYSIKTKKSLRAASQPAVHQQIEVSIVFVSSLVSFPVPVEYSVVLALRSFLSHVHGFARAAHHELIVEQQPPV